MFAPLIRWLDERLDLDGIIAPFKHKTVPTHRLSYWYFFGGITLFLFIIQVLTGILLLLYYRPGANEAYESVQYIMTRVQFGWLIRSIHAWSANLMIFTAFVHMFSVLFLKAYRKPRELTWVSGVILLVLVMGFGFSGYLLPWNTLAFFATKVGTEIAGQVPIIGKPMMIFLRGGEEVTGATLTRFFGFHVAVLPGLVTVLIAIHLFLVQRQGMSVPPKLEAEWTANPSARREMKFFPNFMLRELMAWYVAMGRTGRVGRHLPLEPRRQGRSICLCPGGNQAGVVLPVHVPDPQDHPVQSLDYRRGGFGCAWVAAWPACCGCCCRFLRATASRRIKAWITGLSIFALVYVIGMSVYGFLAK